MPLLWISLAFLSGILIAASLPIPIIAWIFLAISSLIFLLPPVYHRWSRLIQPSLFNFTRQLKINSISLYPLLFLFLSFGAFRYLIAIPDIDPSLIAYYNDRPAESILEGVLLEPPDHREMYTNLRLRVEQIQTLDSNQVIPVHGQVLAQVSPGSSFDYGDIIRLQGHIESPPEYEDFSYRDYLAIQGIYSYMPYPTATMLQHGQGNPLMSALYSFRQHSMDLVYRLFPDPEASLLAGILLGDQSGIPPQVQEAFRLTGTSHIIVISGFNITIIAALFTFLFMRFFGMFRGALLSAIGIILYTLLVGANPAVVRAAILGLFMLLGHLIGRRQVGLNSLIFVAAIMALITPSVLWDVSFQLSFAATLGIMLYAGLFIDGFTNFSSRFMSREKAEKVAGPVGEYLLVTIAALLTTLPLMVYYFNRISITSLIANPLILPAQPPIMILGGLSVLIGMISQPVGQLFAWMALPFTAYTIRIVEWLSAVPHGSIALGQIAFPLILVFYLGLFIITYMRSKITTLVGRLAPAVPLAIMVVFTFFIWKAAFYAPDGLLHVTVLDVGTGDAVLIQSPAGRHLLINGGPSTVRLSDNLGRHLSPIHRGLDWLVVADIDNEDLSALPGNLERFPPSNILWAGNTYGTHADRELWSELISLSTPITRMQPGHSLDMGNGASLQALSTDERGAVLLLKWGNFRMLLPMGMDFQTIENLHRDSSMHGISALLLAESGYAPLNPPEFLSFLQPQLALLSVSPADKTGLPSPETLEALQGYNLLRTDHNGWIEITTDGNQMWVEVEKR